MIIASQKRRDNIAEYLLYMWQIEDIIRANDLDIEKINSNVLAHHKVDEATMKQMKEWYESLIDMMRREEVAKTGHLQMNKNIIGALADLHRQILADPRFDAYRQEYFKTLPYIVELRSKSSGEPVGEIETCFNALYGVLLLRLSGKQVSEATAKAVEQIAKFIALLAKDFHLDEENKLFENDEKNTPEAQDAKNA